MAEKVPGAADSSDQIVIPVTSTSKLKTASSSTLADPPWRKTLRRQISDAEEACSTPYSDTSAEIKYQNTALDEHARASPPLLPPPGRTSYAGINGRRRPQLKIVDDVEGDIVDEGDAPCAPNIRGVAGDFDALDNLACCGAGDALPHESTASAQRGWDFDSTLPDRGTLGSVVRQFGIQPGTKQDRTIFPKKNVRIAIYMALIIRIGSLYCWAMPKKHANNIISDNAQCIAVVSTLIGKNNYL